MNTEQVKGFEELDDMQQELFKRVYHRHQESLGNRDRAAYIPTKVKWDKRKYCLVVWFRNMDWMHYTVTGEWY